jgi:hypothetical protein
MRTTFRLFVLAGLLAFTGCTTRSDWGKNKDYDKPKAPVAEDKS